MAGNWLRPGTLAVQGTGRAYRGADFAILCGHAVSVMQVCKGLGRPPGLQVPGHAHRGPHLGSIEGVARSEEVRTPSFSLGVRNKALPLAHQRGQPSSPCSLTPTLGCPPSHPHGFCPPSFSMTGFQCYKLSSVIFFQRAKDTCNLNLGKNNSHFNGHFYKVNS